MMFPWLVVVFASSWLMTACLRRYALVRNVMDIPNERSAHSIPTPRGGGLSIVLTFLISLPVLVFAGLLTGTEFLAFLGAGALVAVIGFADDHRHISAKWRLLGHFFAAAWVLIWFEGMAPVEMLGVSIAGWKGVIIAAVFLVWMLNLYNFMDGIDGLASVQAISVCLGMCVVYWLAEGGRLVWAPLMLAGAVAGFLCWNFPPARIFMGDAGSGFLGVILGAMALQAAWTSPALMWSWLILLGVFIVDSTFTLVMRLIRGEKVYQAHSSHAYQGAARRWGHTRVTLTIAALNIVYLLPISILVALRSIDAVSGLMLAYVPLGVVACLLKAGRSEPAVK
ncbi:MraY family glycosyltransferase [Pseudomonas frederiksbergensis]|uniref:MraY family glycosyltransferase n=1 Tax=Pseudomonas frederiksbergensis TaxID=104087 RepID=UPI002DBA5BB0|nr:glycosyltransferase family 4 protein [Pseudomonas frederiksbergensis]WRV66833.1 glycosyltransferase family 4 protein [Pseudomonas frederiksbergensis]